jgi:putative copper export protein
VRWLRLIYRLWMTLIAVAVVVQIGAAGYGAFYASNHLKDKGDTFLHKGWDHGWSLHTGLGWLIVYAILIALVLALIARVGRPRIWFQLGLAVAGVLQIVFALAGESHPWVGIFHPLNAFVILGLAGSITAREWGAVRAAPAPVPAPAAE